MGCIGVILIQSWGLCQGLFLPRHWEEGPGCGVGPAGTEVPSMASSVLGFLVLKLGALVRVAFGCFRKLLRLMQG